MLKELGITNFAIIDRLTTTLSLGGEREIRGLIFLGAPGHLRFTTVGDPPHPSLDRRICR